MPLQRARKVTKKMTKCGPTRDFGSEPLCAIPDQPLEGRKRKQINNERWKALEELKDLVVVLGSVGVGVLNLSNGWGFGVGSVRWRWVGSVR